jgi:hypothetical protein
MKENEQFPFT